MAVLIEIGKQYPCSSQGTYVDFETTEAVSGDIIECYFESDHSITAEQAHDVAMQVAKIKEQYPQSVIHYFKVEDRRVTVQYSVAPPSGEITSIQGKVTSIAFVVPLWIVIIILIGAIVGAIFAVVALQRGYLLPVPKPTGTAVITAKDATTKLGLHQVQIYVDGTDGAKTDGGSISVKNLLQGEHKFSGATVSGYQVPDIVSATISKDQVTNVTIWYYPVGTPKPTTGTLEVYTNPPGGEVYIDTLDKGPAPVSVEVSVEEHSVAFGPLEGYITPITQTVTVSGPEPVVIIGYYTLPGAPWWQTLVKWVALGLTGTAAAAILIPRIVKAARERKGAE